MNDAELEVYGELTDVLMVLSEASAGDYGVRVHTEQPADHPLGALAAGLNQLLSSLEEARRGAPPSPVMSTSSLAAPVLPVADRALLVVLAGSLDVVEADRVANRLVDAASAESALAVILDLTAVGGLDAGAAERLGRAARTLGMLGAQCYLTGVSREIAELLCDLDVPMPGLIVLPTLADALARCRSPRASAGS